MFLVVDDQVGKDNGMIRINTQIADPPFRTCSSVTVNDETLWCGVISGSCHETLHIRAMSKFGLCIASKDLAFHGRFQEHFLLFFRTQVIQCHHEHVKMQGQRHLFTEKQLLSLLVVVIERENLMVSQKLFGVDGHSLWTRGLHVKRVEFENWVLGDQSLGFEELFKTLRAAVDHVGEFLLFEGGFLPFVVKHELSIFIIIFRMMS